MKKIYYVVSFEYQEIDGVYERTGFKNITVYTVENNEVSKWFMLDTVENDLSNKEVIEKYLDDNGYSDEKYEFIEL